MARATAERVAVEFVKSLEGIAADKVAANLPEVAAYVTTGFIVVDAIGNRPSFENKLRKTMVQATCWTVNAKNAQKPLWGKANELAEDVVAGLFEENGRVLDLGGAYPRVHVMQAVLRGDPRKVPVSDGTGRARFCVEFELVWTELPS